MPFEIVRNDITHMHTDAIVNAANSSLLGGGGVDGAIHRAAGPELLAECRTLGGCATGQSKITGAYRLPCKYVIHTVGPVWYGGSHGEEALLASCYRSSLSLATEHGCESVAFPLISAGAYGYPRDKALRVAADTIRDFLLDHDMRVYLVVFDRGSFSISQKLYANIQAFIDDEYIGPEYERYELMRKRHGPNRPSHPSYESIGGGWDEPCADATDAIPHSIFPEADKESSAKESFGVSAPKASAAESLDDYLSRIDEGFRDMLLRKIDERGITDAECYKGANIDRKLFNKIKNQPDYRPGKSTVLALAVSLRLPLEETREMLMKAGFSLSHSSKFDLIVEYFIRHENYDIFEINEALFSFDQKLLGSLA